nr:PAS domain S-box protein [Candidatus Dependentiae bacterium]
MDSHISHNQTITSVIYILDDSKTELLIAEQIIVSKKIGKVSCFDNSKLFYKAIETQLPDIILIEMNMADTNSIDICLHLKSQPIIQFIPIILISASNDVETVKKCFSSGASDYISKPFIEDEMIARIRMHLSLKKIEDEMKIKNNSSETSLNEITSIEYINEYKRPYKTLQEKLRSYRKLFESSHDGYVVVDINGRFIEANNAYCKMLGYKINELMEKENFYAITPERWRKWEYDEIWKNRLLEIGVSGIYEKEYIRKDGTIFPVEIQAFTIFDDNRNIKYIYGFVRDITKHKLKENFLKESKQQLLDIINFLPDAIFAIDTSGKVIAWNFAIEKMTQVKAEDILGKGDYEYSLPFYGVRRPILIDLVSLNSQEIEDKYHFVRKEGDRLLAEISVMVGGQRRELWGIAKPLYNSEGKIVGAIESIRDITEFKLTENALKESEKFLRTVTDKVPEAIYVFNISKDGKMSFDFISGYAQELFGYSPQELKNNFSLALNLVIPEDAQGLQDSILTASSNKHDWNYDFRIYTQNGKKKWIRGMSALHEVSKDATIVFIGSLSDITEKKQAEEKIIEANKKLLAATQQSKALNQELITSNKNLLNKNIELKMKNFAIDTSINAIAFIDVNGKIFYVNNSLVKMWGYDNKEEIIGMIPSDLHPPGVFENEKNMFDIIAERGGLSDEIKARRKNGDLFDIHYTCSIVKDYDDNILCTMSVIEDITNRRKSENEILEKTTLLNAQLEISIDGILMVDSNEKVINYNSRFGELWQIPQHILDTKNDNTILEYVLKQLKNPQEFIDKVKYLYENKKEKSRDEIEFANGGYLDRYSAPITKPNGEYFGRIWFFRDITDKKKIEILLKESEQKFRTIFNSSSIGIAITKIDGTLLETNESFIKIFNFPNKEKILKSNASYF